VARDGGGTGPADLALRRTAMTGATWSFRRSQSRLRGRARPKRQGGASPSMGRPEPFYSTLACGWDTAECHHGRAECGATRRCSPPRRAASAGCSATSSHEGGAALILFFPDEHSSAETRPLRGVRPGPRQSPRAGYTLDWWRSFRMSRCSDPVPDSYVKRLRAKGKMEFNCPCAGRVSLASRRERIHFRSKVEAMDQSADTASGTSICSSCRPRWRLARRRSRTGPAASAVTLAIVFHDVVGSTALARKSGMRRWTKSDGRTFRAGG